jgi:hypothetical protein
VVPRITAPEFRSRATAGASFSGMLPRFTTLPISQRCPAVEIEDFTVTGKPASAPGVFDEASTERACARTRWGSKSTSALICGFSRSIWQMYSFASSRAEVCLVRSRTCSSKADCCVSGKEVCRTGDLVVIFISLTQTISAQSFAQEMEPYAPLRQSFVIKRLRESIRATS